MIRERPKAIRARELFEQIRRENPEIDAAEKALGLRLVVARNVLRYRNRRGMTQRELGAAIGVSQPRIAEIESAACNLQIDTLRRLADAFSIEPASLLRRAEQGAGADDDPAHAAVAAHDPGYEGSAGSRR